MAHDGSPLAGQVTMRLWKCAVLVIVGALAIEGVALYLTYSRDLQAINARLVAGSQVVETSHGPVEYATLGDDPPVLVIHGSGGGYDQGLLLAKAFGGEGFRWISPSRFGYLRSPLPADASTAAQADAFAELLDALGTQRVAILAMSGGVPPALQFTERYPDRTSALILLSAAPYTLFGSEQELPGNPGIACAAHAGRSGHGFQHDRRISTGDLTNRWGSQRGRSNRPEGAVPVRGDHRSHARRARAGRPHQCLRLRGVHYCPHSRRSAYCPRHGRPPAAWAPCGGQDRGERLLAAAHQGNGTMKIERTRWISQAIREFLASERKPAANEQ